MVVTTNLEINKLYDLSLKIYSLTQNPILTHSKRRQVKLEFSSIPQNGVIDLDNKRHSNTVAGVEAGSDLIRRQ